MSVCYRVLTSEGRGAIAVVRVWGVAAVEVVDAVFRPHRGGPLKSTPSGRLRLGRAGLGLGDEVVAVRVDAEPPSVEIQCHGGTAAVDSVLAALESAGARPGDLGGGDTVWSHDPVAASALEDLAGAPTVRTAEILLDQLHGALGLELDRLRRAWEGSADDGAAPGLAELDALIRRGALGLRLISGWKVVIAGRPNVGKSRLFNALAGFDRAIVDPRAGVTRDVVTFRTAFGGWPVELADTAGLRGTDDAIEHLGILRSQRAQEAADLILLVLDRSEPLHPADLERIGAIPHALHVANKSDLPPAWELRQVSPGSSSIVAVSAEHGQGLADLIAAIIARVVPDPPGPGAAVPFRPAHREALRAARDCLLAGDRAAAARRLEAVDHAPGG